MELPALQAKLQWRVALQPGVRVCNGTGAPLALCLSSPASLAAAPARHADTPLAGSSGQKGPAEAAQVESQTLLELAPEHVRSSISAQPMWPGGVKVRNKSSRMLYPILRGIWLTKV